MGGFFCLCPIACCWCCRTQRHAYRSIGEEANEAKDRPPKVQVDTEAVLGLRCLAAVIVAYGHWPMLNGSLLYEYHGGAAVTLFFVVSGFIMTIAYRARVGGGQGFDFQFLLRR